MFAYCLNNPVTRLDISGTADAICYSDDADLFERMLEGAAGSFGGLVVFATASAIIRKEEHDAKTAAAVTANISQSSALFYGAEYTGGKNYAKEWRICTSPMDFETAIVWVTVNAVLGTYGRNASWGVYTAYRDDALDMAISLGGIGPCLHEKNIGEYPHFHPVGMALFGYYRHFHIWYDEIYEGEPT